MKKIIRQFKSSILMQLTGIIGLIIIVLVTSIIVTQNYITKMERSSAESLCGSLLKQSCDAFGLYQEELRYQASMFCRLPVEDFLEDLAGEDRIPPKEVLTDEEKKEILDRMQEGYKRMHLKNGEIVSLAIYDRNLRKAASFGRDFDLLQEQVYMRSDDDFNAEWNGEVQNGFYYYYYYPIYDRTSGDETPIGMCVFRLDHWTLDGTLRNILSNYSAAILLSDRNIPQLSFIKSGDIGDESSMAQLEDNPDIIIRSGNWERGIKIKLAISVARNWTLEESLKRTVWPLYLVAIILLGILIFYSYNHMAAPIHKITQFIDNAIAHPNDRLQVQRKDDIGVVAQSLNHMLDENQKMIGEIRKGKILLYEEQIQRQKMEILAYRNQINPHFLYNTLSCIRDMAVFYDVDQIAEMAMALSDIFRYAVNGSNIVTVKDELEYTQIYATIIRYRHMDKITIKTEADSEALDKHIFRLMLQPLVENAVLHGMVENIRPGTVSVRIRHLADTRQLEIVTSDDGTGMDEEKLESVRKLLEKPKENESIGISNIVMRLRLVYGDQYSMRIESRSGEGTEVTVIIPDHIDTEDEFAQKSEIQVDL